MKSSPKTWNARHVARRQLLMKMPTLSKCGISSGDPWTFNRIRAETGMSSPQVYLLVRDMLIEGTMIMLKEPKVQKMSYYIRPDKER